MTSITRHDIQRVAVSAIGALLISAACIGAAVFPVKAAETGVSTATEWQAEVEKRIDRELRSPFANSNAVTMTGVAMHFDDRGNFRSATLEKSSGVSAIDREAIRVARTIRYPALPTYLQGKRNRIEMRIFFGNSAQKLQRERDAARRAAAALAAKADAKRDQARFAALPTG